MPSIKKSSVSPRFFEKARQPDFPYDISKNYVPKNCFLAQIKLVLGPALCLRISLFGPASHPALPLHPPPVTTGWKGTRPGVEATTSTQSSDRRRPQCTSSGCLRRQHPGPILRSQCLSHLACKIFTLQTNVCTSSPRQQKKISGLPPKTHTYTCLKHGLIVQ